MESDPVSTKPQERAREQHARLRDHAERLGIAASSLPNDAERLRWLGDLCASLSEFTDLLLEHFEAEENDGAFQDLVEQHPGLLPEIRKLEQQHRDMTTLVVGLRGVVGDELARSLSAALQELIEQFQAHEAAENQFLLGAVNDELGGG